MISSMMIGLPENESTGTGMDKMLSGWYQCGLKLVEQAGLIGKNHWTLPLLYEKHSREKSSDFLILLYSVMYTESGFRARAISEAKAYGLMQITNVAMREASAQCDLPVIPMEKLLDSATNVRYGSCYLQYLMGILDGDIDQVLIVYNGGFKQLTRYLKGESIVTETANYVLRVRRAITTCQEK